MRSYTRPRSRCSQGEKKRKKCGAVFSPAKKVPMHKKQEESKNTALASSCTCSRRRRRRRRRRWWNKKSKNVALPRPHYEGITGGSCGGCWPLQGKYEKSSARNSRAGFCTPACQSACPRKHSSTDSGVYCDVPCTFCTLALGCSVRCHAHYVEYNEKGGFFRYCIFDIMATHLES